MTQNWSLLFFGLGSHVVTSKLQTHYIAVHDLESLILVSISSVFGLQVCATHMA